MSRFVCPVVCLLVVVSAAIYAPAAEFMFRADVDGETIEGRPLDWNDHNMTLLGRDGHLHVFNPKKAKNAKRTAPRFKGYSDSEMRARLYREFGDRYQFTSTGHYLVVHPRGEAGLWAKRFEQIYKAFLSYVRVRGFQVREPEFPLVAVVFRNRGEYDSFVRRSKTKALPNTLGHYNHESNRVYLFDITAENSGRDWSENAETIIHEVTHQMAFNLGVHSRPSPPPYWIPEGLATVFEARGVWRPRGSDRREDRINQGRLRDFRHFAKDGDAPFSLKTFVASDTPFRSNGAAAYAQAWALSFYLSETQPRAFCQHLAATADRPVYSLFSAGERLKLFKEAFGSDLEILEANFMRWIEAL